MASTESHLQEQTRDTTGSQQDSVAKASIELAEETKVTLDSQQTRTATGGETEKALQVPVLQEASPDDEKDSNLVSLFPPGCTR